VEAVAPAEIVAPVAEADVADVPTAEAEAEVETAVIAGAVTKEPAEARLSEVEALGMFQAQAMVEWMAEQYGSPAPETAVEQPAVAVETAVEPVEPATADAVEPDAPEQPAGQGSEGRS
jgi:hypothetical protein